MSVHRAMRRASVIDGGSAMGGSTAYARTCTYKQNAYTAGTRFVQYGTRTQNRFLVYEACMGLSLVVVFSQL